MSKNRTVCWAGIWIHKRRDKGNCGQFVQELKLPRQKWYSRRRMDELVWKKTTQISLHENLNNWKRLVWRHLQMRKFVCISLNYSKPCVKNMISSTNPHEYITWMSQVFLWIPQKVKSCAQKASGSFSSLLVDRAGIKLQWMANGCGNAAGEMLLPYIVCSQEPASKMDGEWSGHGTIQHDW